MRFVPPEIHVHAGDTVTWVNEDSVSHSSAADTYQSPWDTGEIKPGDSSSPITFAAPGHFPYHCGFHPDMHAWVKVI